MTTLLEMTPAEQAFMAKRMPRRFAQLKADYQEHLAAKALKDAVENATQEAKRREVLERWKSVEKAKTSNIIRLGDIKTAYMALSTIRWVDIVSARRTRYLVDERHALMWLAIKHTKASYPVTAKWLGRSDHSTAWHGVKKVNDNFDDYAKLIESVERQIGIE
jgi:chromosomal replication initiation ATPase DnaA